MEFGEAEMDCMDGWFGIEMGRGMERQGKERGGKGALAFPPPRAFLPLPCVGAADTMTPKVTAFFSLQFPAS